MKRLKHILRTSRRASSALLGATLLVLGAAVASSPAVAQEDAAADALQQVKERGFLEVAVYEDFAPYSAVLEGRATGVDVDLAAALARELGVKLQIRPFLADENMEDDLRNHIWKGHYLGGGTADLMLHVGLDPAFAAANDQAAFFGGYLHEVVTIIYREGRYQDMDSPLRLAGSRVAVEVDSISDYYLSGAFNGRLREAAVRMPSAQAAAEAFIRGEVDAVMGPSGQMQGLMKLLNDEGVATAQTEFQGMFRTAWDVGMAVKAGNDSLQAALEVALDRLDRSGELRRIFASHGIEHRPASFRGEVADGK